MSFNQTDAYQLANRLLRENDLNTWSFIINDRPKTRLGLCSHRKKTIQLSGWVLDKCPQNAENTIRHEVAHALVGPGHGHNNVWKQAAIKLGARPQACTNVPIKDRAPFKWMLHCPKCLNTCGGSYRKRSAQYVCRKCRVRLEQRRVV